jgi:hypothetical protein
MQIARGRDAQRAGGAPQALEDLAGVVAARVRVVGTHVRDFAEGRLSVERVDGHVDRARTRRAVVLVEDEHRDRVFAAQPGCARVLDLDLRQNNDPGITIGALLRFPGPSLGPILDLPRPIVGSACRGLFSAR